MIIYINKHLNKKSINIYTKKWNKMNTKKLLVGFIVSIFILQTLLLFSTPFTKANTTIPDKFNKKLDLNEVYIYNVTSFNTSKPLEWASLDWLAPPKGFANTTPGGQIRINFTGFYDKDPNDFFNIFESPIPYMDVEFVENRFGNLVTNATFYNVSNGEADMNLLLGYNQFKSGFLIPINNFDWLKQQAYAQDQPPFMNATVIVKETPKNITFDFSQKTGLQQKTKSIYDKKTGLLIYTNTSFGNYTLEMALINLPIFTSEKLFIPSFQLYVLFGAITVISVIYIAKLRKK